ncbi:uncharacterized protein At4g15970-like [Silene latifolia]|uniref:uncharacterized protein At4g15970-like n=1 Tax=Silene latifolia TaxID=37657 RepID=UPI003D77B62F
MSMLKTTSLIKSLDFAKTSKVLVSFSTVVVAFGFIYCVLFNNYGGFLPSFNSSCINGNGIATSSSRVDTVIPDEYYELRKVLKAAATKDNTVILATLNEAWAAPNSIFDLFLESFRIGNNTARLLDHLLVIAVDDKAYNRCRSSVSHCYFLKTNHSSENAGQADFMSPHYLDIIWQRLAFSHTILTLGYNFINTDTDVMWFRDPLPIFTQEFDFQLSCDSFNGKENDFKNHPNVGLMYIKSNNRTIKFYDFWVKARPYFPKRHEQDVFNVLKHGQYIKEIGLKVRFMDTNYFGGFCTPSKDFNKVCTMHANCRVGLPRKIADLNTTLEDWKNYTLSSNKTSTRFKWRIENA